MKKVPISILIMIGMICSIGIGFYVFGKEDSLERAKIASRPFTIEEKLPFGIERNNPVPEVKHWNFQKKTYYYFNWGLKKTMGYSLEVVSVKNHRLKIKAHSPPKDQMLIEALNFPSLLISLPQGSYSYEVVNEQGEGIPDVFVPQNQPLKITIFLPKAPGKLARREILRETTCLAQEKPLPLIALESLFNQQEMQDFTSRGIRPEKVIWTKFKNQWLVEVSRAFEGLDSEQKKLLCEIIRKTVITLSFNPSYTVKIVAVPERITST